MQRNRKLVEFFVCVALVVVTLLVYSPSLDHPFVDYDDRYYVVQNEHVHHGLSVDGLRYAFSTYDGRQLAPADLAVAAAGRHAVRRHEPAAST